MNAGDGVRRPGRANTDITETGDTETGDTAPLDADGDGYLATDDCDDTRADVHPGAVEVCDAADVDEDCDGTADDADASTDSTSWSTTWADGGGDGEAATFAAGDFDGDGVGDVILGAPANDDGGKNAGAAWLLYGPLTGSLRLGVDEDASWTATGAADTLGSAVAVLRDTDGDGDDEIVLTAPGAGTDWGNNGTVWVWPGR